MEPWIYRLAAIAGAALAGWALGRSNPGWDSDMEEFGAADYGPYGWGHRGFGYGMRSFSGNCLAGTGALAGWALLAFIGFLYGWPTEGLDSSSSTEMETSWFLWFFNRGFWLLILCFFASYAAARFTDKGPVGPLE